MPKDNQKEYSSKTDPRNALKNNWKYNGVELNKELGGIFEMPFRGYDPSLGRFMQVDPLAELMMDQNPYHFGYNNPVNFSDPSGLSPQGESRALMTEICNREGPTNKDGTFAQCIDNKDGKTGTKAVSADEYYKLLNKQNTTNSSSGSSNSGRVGQLTPEHDLANKKNFSRKISGVFQNACCFKMELNGSSFDIFETENFPKNVENHARFEAVFDFSIGPNSTKDIGQFGYSYGVTTSLVKLHFTYVEKLNAIKLQIISSPIAFAVRWTQDGDLRKAFDIFLKTTIIDAEVRGEFLSLGLGVKNSTSLIDYINFRKSSNFKILKKNSIIRFDGGFMEINIPLRKDSKNITKFGEDFGEDIFYWMKISGSLYQILPSHK